MVKNVSSTVSSMTQIGVISKRRIATFRAFFFPCIRFLCLTKGVDHQLFTMVEGNSRVQSWVLKHILSLWECSVVLSEIMREYRLDTPNRPKRQPHFSFTGSLICGKCCKSYTQTNKTVLISKRGTATVTSRVYCFSRIRFLSTTGVTGRDRESPGFNPVF